MSDNYEKFYELLDDKELAKEVLSIEKPEDAQVWLSDHGVELTLDEIKEIGEFLSKIASGEITAETLDKIYSGELSDDELARVAGGRPHGTSGTSKNKSVLKKIASFIESIVGWGW